MDNDVKPGFKIQLSWSLTLRENTWNLKLYETVIYPWHAVDHIPFSSRITRKSPVTCSSKQDGRPLSSLGSWTANYAAVVECWSLSFGRPAMHEAIDIDSWKRILYLWASKTWKFLQSWFESKGSVFFVMALLRLTCAARSAACCRSAVCPMAVQIIECNISVWSRDGREFSESGKVAVHSLSL